MGSRLRPCASTAPASRQSERAFQAQVVQAARLLGWWVFHDRDSRGSEAGLPDLILIRPPRVLWLELKGFRADGRRGPLSHAQQRVLAALAASGQAVYAFWPDDWDQLETLLQGSAGERTAMLPVPVLAP